MAGLPCRAMKRGLVPLPPIPLDSDEESDTDAAPPTKLRKFGIELCTVQQLALPRTLRKPKQHYPPIQNQCSAQTSSGHRCLRTRQIGSRFCWQHDAMEAHKRKIHHDCQQRLIQDQQQQLRQQQQRLLQLQQQEQRRQQQLQQQLLQQQQRLQQLQQQLQQQRQLRQQQLLQQQQQRRQQQLLQQQQQRRQQQEEREDEEEEDEEEKEEEKEEEEEEEDQKLIKVKKKVRFQLPDDAMDPP